MLTELKDMSFAELAALKESCEYHIRHYDVKFSKEAVEKWEFHKAIVQQHINKKTAEYFGEEPIT